MNRALTSDREYFDNCLPLHKANYKLLQLALVAAGYSEDRYSVLKPACQTDRLVLEERKHEWVKFYINALSLSVDLDTIPDLQACNLLSSDNAVITLPGTFASKTTVLTGTNNDLVFTARKKGSIYNLLQVQYVNPAGNNQALSVSMVGSLIRVSLATGAGGAITSTATLIKNALTANAAINALIATTLAASNTGAGIVTAMAAENLAGGTD